MEEEKVVAKEETKTEIEQENKPQELTALEIGKIKEKKKGNVMGLVAFFVIIMTFIFFLPYIEEYINKMKGLENNPGIITDPNTSDEKEKDNKEEGKPLHIENASFVVDNFVFSNFSLENTTQILLTFVVSTSGENTLYLNNSNIYLELYSGENALLQRLKIDSDSPISKNNSLTLSFVLNESVYVSATNVLVVAKSSAEYPNVTLNKDGEGNQILICASGEEKITYYFTDNKLNRLEAINTFYLGSDYDEYVTLLGSKKVEAGVYNARNGFVSTVTEVSGGTSFTMATSVDLAQGQITAQDEVAFYNKDTLAKVVSFEMKAREFNCN